MSKKGKIIIGLTAVGVLAIVVVVSGRRSAEDAVKVEVAKVENRDLSALVEASGQIEPAISVDISSDVIGKIIAVGVEEGDGVKKGQFLIQIDPAQYEQRLERVRAELEVSRTSLTEAEAGAAVRRSEYERARRLFAEKLISASQFDSAQAAFNVAEAQVASARNRILTAEAAHGESADNLARCRILSPMAGIVIRKNAEVGEVAISGTLNNQGSLLMTIADLSVMKTEVDVDETDVVHVDLGHEVEISLDAFPARKFKGEVTRIGNSAIQQASAPGQRQSADYKVEVTLKEADEKIRPGLSATARITTAERKGVLSVPIQALVVRELGGKKDKEGPAGAPAEVAAAPAGEEGSEAEGGETPASGSGVVLAAEEPAEGGGEAEESAAAESEGDDGKQPDKQEKEGVFVVRDGKAVFVPVKTGIAGEKYFEVLEGLELGDEIVSGNFASLRKLKDGDRVEVEKPRSKDKDKDEAKEAGAGA